MRKWTGVWLACAIVILSGVSNAIAAPPIVPPPGGIDNYEPGPDSKPQAGVPKGKQFSFAYDGSKIFPGTRRQVSVYVPAQYKADKPACVYVGLDGLGFNVPVVFDNLIHKAEMPVTIAIGVSSGTAVSVNEKDDPRFNRSFEFDALNDQLARCVVDEVFPEVESRKTPDGLAIRLSRDPNDHCAGGGSTGGIGAFTLAWERPDLFRRVFSGIGTFVCMRGGDRYPVLVRKTEPKPIRVFQQDGENDEWMGGPEVGDWWMGNVTLERALEFSGYDHQHVWGTGPHSGKHATAIFPDAMRFLWKDYPKTIEPQTARTQNVLLKAILDPAARWEQVKEAGEHCEGLAVKPGGDVVFYDAAAKRSRHISADGTVADDEAGAQKVLAFTAGGHPVAAGGQNATCVTATAAGNVYLTQADAGQVWLVKPDGAKVMLDEGLRGPCGIALSPDGLWLALFEGRTHWGYSYRVKSDGGVELKQRFYWAHVPDTADDSGAEQACMDRDGHPYVATNMGVQVFDRNGRSRGILSMPGGGTPAAATAVCFGGAKFDALYVITAGRVWKRHMKATGAPGFLPPIKLPPWGAG
jgi:enterochelin esterase-like enzyme